MTEGSTAAQYDRWSAALLDVLLPELPECRNGQVVLLACDDEAVLAAAATSGGSSSNPAAEFGRLVEAHFHIARDGSPDALRRTAARFRADPRRPGEVVPFFGACCAFVLAASRMTTDGEAHAVNYYDRLWEVLGRRPVRAGQYDFSYLPHLFRYLAQWLREDLEGVRGHLYVPEGGLHHVGYAINQCLFRARDKEHLAEFFARRVGRRRRVDVDLLRLLQVSSDRHCLTHRARQAVAAAELQGLVQAALTHAFQNWDGSRPDHRGGRSWLASLHLSVNRQLRLSVSAPEAPAGLVLDSTRVLARPERDRVRLYPSELVELAGRGLRWGPADDNGIYLPAAGETLVFEVREDTGLLWVQAPVADHVFVLTADPALQRQLANYACRLPSVDALPGGWSVYERVPADTLPAEGVSKAIGRPPVALAGGLRLGPRQYLTGHGPRVEVGDVDALLSVRVGGVEVAVAHAGADVWLDLAAGEHHVDVGDGLVAWTVHMLDRNPARPGYGEVVYPLTDYGGRVGATSRGVAHGPVVRGALLSEAYTGDIPLMLRAPKVVFIAADGGSETRYAPVRPGWLAHIGLPPEGVRWEAELAPEAVWALTGEQAIAIRPHVPAQLDPGARGAVEMLARRANPRVRSLRRADRAAAAEAFLEMATRPELVS